MFYLFNFVVMDDLYMENVCKRFNLDETIQTEKKTGDI